MTARLDQARQANAASALRWPTARPVDRLAAFESLDTTKSSWTRAYLSI